MVKIRPMNGFLIVEKDPTPDKIHEIVLPEMNSIRPASGTVRDVAPDLVGDYEPGMKLLFGKHAGESFTVEDSTGHKVTCTSLHRTEIQAWIPKDAVVSA